MVKLFAHVEIFYVLECFWVFANQLTVHTVVVSSGRCVDVAGVVSDRRQVTQKRKIIKIGLF